MRSILEFSNKFFEFYSYAKKRASTPSASKSLSDFRIRNMNKLFKLKRFHQKRMSQSKIKMDKKLVNSKINKPKEAARDAKE
jgi:hypothetical protein